MANIKSMKKDLRRNAKARAVNLAVKSSLKTYIKKAKGAAGKDAEATSVCAAIKALDKAAQKGIIHKNQAARRKSRLLAAVKKATP